MRSASFIYHDPRSIAEATRLLAAHDNTRVLAGGQSLLPMLRLRRTRPDHVIDLHRIDALAYLRIDGEALHAGAMTRQRDLEFSIDVADRLPLLQEALRHVGHRETRSRGTFGGSLCHFDPCAELVNVTALLGGVVHLASARGRRTLPMAAFAVGHMKTALEFDELLTGVTLPLPPRDAGYAFVEYAHRYVDFAVVACSALMTLDRHGRIAYVCLAISGLGDGPVRPRAVERALTGERPGAGAFQAAAAAAVRDALATRNGVSGFQQQLARTLTCRALEQAAERVRGEERVMHSTARTILRRTAPTTAAP